MDLLQWIIFFLAVQVVHFAGTWRLYEKAGRKRWEALVPVYNAVVLMRIIRRSPWWTLLLFVPIVNLIMFPVVWVQILKAFGKTSTTDYLLGIVTLGLYIFVVNYDDKVTYNGDLENKESTVSSLLFAIVVATIVHTYIMQPFTIPTGSLEKTLLIGDFLFVSKFHYGARTPMTTVAAPMVHDSIPFTKMKSFSNWPQLPYFRFPGFEKIEKNDIVVFNWPTDTVRFMGDTIKGLRKPIDKKSNYVKRCVATPGDMFSIKDGLVYINNKELKLSDRALPQYNYTVKRNGDVSATELNKIGVNEIDKSYVLAPGLTQIQADAIKPYVRGSRNFEDGSIYIVTDINGIPLEIIKQYGIQLIKGGGSDFIANLTFGKADQLRKVSGVESVTRIIHGPGEEGTKIFPHTKPSWSGDNEGPFYIPEKGKTVDLTPESLPFYKMIITEYEHNTLEVNGNDIKINGKPTTTYTFKQNYYFMMGDNRHNSLDSRYWGFVPEDHVVGKPVFVWMSLDENVKWFDIKNKVRWDRMFTTVGGSGEPVSYFKYFLIALVGWFTFDYFRKKKKKAETKA